MERPIAGMLTSNRFQQRPESSSRIVVQTEVVHTQKEDGLGFV